MNSALLITSATSLALGIAAGFAMHRSDFCMAGMFRDLLLFRSGTMLRILVLTVAATMATVELARQAGFVGTFPFHGFSAPAMTTVVGGVLFGIGMVLSGGCVAGTLYKLGSGNSVSLAAFVGLITGSALYAEFHTLWAPLAVKTRFRPQCETIAGMTGFSQGAVVAVCLLVLGGCICSWHWSGKLVRKSSAVGYLQPWKAAIILALLGTASVVVIGVPLGITTSYSKIGAMLQNTVLSGHVQGLEYFKSMPFTYDNRLLGIRYSGGPGPTVDSISYIQFPLIAGLIIGGFLSAVLVNEFRIYRNVPQRQIISGLAGGMVMGLAARMAPSCNIWHLLGGVPILATQSLLFVIGLVPGAWLGCRLLTGLVIRDDQ